MKSVISSAAVLSTFVGLSDGCSNIIVTPGASSDSSSIIAYNADSATLYGSLYHYPKADHKEGDMRDIYDWDSGKYLGQIEEVSHTYNVVGNINEHGVIIGETTYGGIASLQSQPGAIMDYGSLIWVTLQRSKTAREAITTIGDLMATYGYASEGESFSIGDSNEAWVMDIIGKGEYGKGAVWVARKVPDGYVSGHANQARITTFPLHDEENCMYASDTISFARDIGLYHGKDEDFSFVDVYDPLTFDGARFCEARVWTFFGAVMGEEWMEEYESYAMGYNLTNRMPLWVKPPSPVSVKNAIAYMRDRYENTALDMTGHEFSDVGADYGSNPMRVRPLTWTYGDNEYFNERAIGTPQTGWNFVAQSRRWMPQELSGLIWFGVDDSSTTVHIPVYGSASEVPQSWAGKGAQDGVTAPILKFDFDSAFTVFNLVANWAYSRWDTIYPDVLDRILSTEDAYFSEVLSVDKQASEIYTSKGSDAAVDYVTDYSVSTGNSLVKQWGSFFGELFMKYRDGYAITASVDNQACACNAASNPYPEKWYERIVNDTGDHYLVPEEASVNQATLNTLDAKLKPVSKRSVLERK